MNAISASVTIGAPPERVYEILLDLSARPAFTDHFMSELHLQRILPGVGASARFQTGPRRNRIWMETVLTEADAPTRIAERGRGGRLDRIPIFTDWELRQVAGPRTEVTVSFRTEPGLRSDRMMEMGSRLWYRRRWGRALSRLRDIVESQAAPERIQIAGGNRVPTT